MSGDPCNNPCTLICGPCVRRESFIGKETLWTGWHRRPPPRDPFDTRDKCALRCAVDPEKKTEHPPCENDVTVESGVIKASRPPGNCQVPPYPRETDPQIAFIKKLLNNGKDVTTEEKKRFAETAVGVFGTRRETMLENCLLQRQNKVGVSLRSVYDLPGEHFTYGHLNQPGWKASDALRGWQGTGLVEPSRQNIPKAPRGLCCTDILALNRAAINAGIVTAPEFRVYRDTHSAKFSKHARRNVERLPVIAADKNKIYGIKSNYVTNMKELLSNQELQEWEQCIKNCYRERLIVKQQSRPDKWKENTSCWLRTAHSVKGPQNESLWHMPKFESKAVPHLCTFRSNKAREAAHKANQLEKVGRDGFFGEGITTRAVNKADLIYPTKN